MRMNISIKWGDTAKKISNAVNLGQVALDSQVLKDSNYYAPQDTGNLIQASIRDSQPGEGKIVWDTPYARRLYYNPQYNFSSDKNANAGGLWFERAKASNVQNWTAIIQKIIKNEI